MSHDLEHALSCEQTPARPRWVVHVGLFVLAGVACVGVRLAFPNDPLIWDDAYYLRRAELIAAGKPICFQGADYMSFRIALLLPMAGAIKLFGESLFSYWLVALGYAFLEGGFCYLVGRRLGGPAVGVAAAVLLAAHPISIYDGSLLLPDHAINAWFTMCIWGLLRFRVASSDRGRVGWALLAGGMLFLGYATRMTVFFLAPVVLLVPGRKRYWLAIAGMAAGFLVGWISESSLHFAFTGDWLNRLRNTGGSYAFWLERLTLAGGPAELFTRWRRPFHDVYGWMPLTIGSGVLAVGMLVFGRWRGRLLGVWFLLPTLIVLFGIRKTDPWTALLHPNVNYLAMPATAAALALAWAGASVSRRLSRKKQPHYAALQILGTVALVAAGVFCMIQHRRYTASDPGHPWRLAGAIHREYDKPDPPSKTYANRWALAMVRLFGDDRVKADLHDGRQVLVEGGSFPADSVVLLDKYALANRDGNQFELRRADDPTWLPAAADLLSPRVAHPPPHWQLLEGGWRTRHDWYVLYRVHEVGESFIKSVDLRTGRGFWSADTTSLDGWCCFPRKRVRDLKPVDSPLGPATGIRLSRKPDEDRPVYLITGSSPEIGNLAARLRPEDVDRVPVDAAKLYQVRWLARLHGERANYVVIRLYEFGPTHLRSEDLTRATYRVLLTPTRDFQKASFSFRVQPKTRYLRIGFSANRGMTVDLADVKLIEYTR